MRAEDGKVEGQLVVAEDLRLNGMVTDNVTVVSQGRLSLYGMCCRDLILEPGSEVEVNGMVVGSVFNRGGRLVVRGMDTLRQRKAARPRFCRTHESSPG